MYCLKVSGLIKHVTMHVAHCYSLFYCLYEMLNIHGWFFSQFLWVKWDNS